MINFSFPPLTISKSLNWINSFFLLPGFPLYLSVIVFCRLIAVASFLLGTLLPLFQPCKINYSLKSKSDGISLTRKKNLKFCILVLKSVLKMTHKVLNINLSALQYVSLFACRHRYVRLHTSLSIPSTLSPLGASSLFIAFPKHNIVCICPDHHTYILTPLLHMVSWQGIPWTSAWHSYFIFMPFLMSLCFCLCPSLVFFLSVSVSPFLCVTLLILHLWHIPIVYFYLMMTCHSKFLFLES